MDKPSTSLMNLSLGRKGFKVLLGLAWVPAALINPAAAQALSPPLELAFFHAFRPGVLSQCQYALDLPGEATWRPEKAAWKANFAFKLSWQDGTYQQDGPMPDPAGPGTDSLIDVCFMLLAAGKPFVSGAVVREGSARLLNFPTLVRMRTPPGEPARFELHPRFPATR